MDLCTLCITNTITCTSSVLGEVLQMVQRGTLSVLTTGEHVFVDLEQNGHSDVVFGHHSVQHDLRALRVGHGHLVELHSVFLNQSKPAETSTEQHKYPWRTLKKF